MRFHFYSLATKIQKSNCNQEKIIWKIIALEWYLYSKATVSENIIGARKKQNDYDAIQIIIQFSNNVILDFFSITLDLICFK